MAVVIGVFIRASNPFNRPGAAWSLVDAYGLSLLVPVVAVLFATAALGDLAEDGTLVYLWLNECSAVGSRSVRSPPRSPWRFRWR